MDISTNSHAFPALIFICSIASLPAILLKYKLEKCSTFFTRPW